MIVIKLYNLGKSLVFYDGHRNGIVHVWYFVYGVRDTGVIFITHKPETFPEYTPCCRQFSNCRYLNFLPRDSRRHSLACAEPTSRLRTRLWNQSSQCDMRFQGRCMSIFKSTMFDCLEYIKGGCPWHKLMVSVSERCAFMFEGKRLFTACSL